jgi:GT2 family glycosyltransferase
LAPESPKIAIVIPTYSIRPALLKMEIDNARVWKTLCEELIICEDGGEYSQELEDIASEYMYHPNVGVCHNMNLGWALALQKGAEYVVIMDDDVSYVEGDLRSLCVQGAVSVPQVIEFPNTAFIAPMLCVPKDVSDRIGLYDCRNHRNEGFDADLEKIVRPIVNKVESFKVSHRGPLGVVGGATRFNHVF